MLVQSGVGSGFQKSLPGFAGGFIYDTHDRVHYQFHSGGARALLSAQGTGKLEPVYCTVWSSQKAFLNIT